MGQSQSQIMFFLCVMLTPDKTRPRGMFPPKVVLQWMVAKSILHHFEFMVGNAVWDLHWESNQTNTQLGF